MPVRPSPRDARNRSSRVRYLNPAQLELLATLDGGFAPEDSVGRPVRWLSPAEIELAEGLVERGLAEVSMGWRGSAWLRITASGRRVLAEVDA